MVSDICVIFDMDGVIMDNNFYHEKAWRTFCKIHNIYLSDEEFHRYVFGRISNDTMNFIFKKNHTEAEIDRYVDEKENIYRQIYKDKIKMTEGLSTFLNELKKMDVPIALATSAPTENVEFAFSYLPIRNFFKCILDASDIVKGKPDPEIYIKAIGQLGIKPERCIVFEDSISGVMSALNAGTHVIGVATTHDPEEFDGVSLVIENFKSISFNKMTSILN